jgi:hypothetical protein
MLQVLQQLDCHPKTVRIHLKRFNGEPAMMSNKRGKAAKMFFQNERDFLGG